MGRACVAWTVLCLGLSACGGGGAETPEALGREVLDALKDGDVDAILPHFVTLEDADWIHDRLTEAGDPEAPDREKLRRAASDGARTSTRKDWQKILDRGEKDGVDWSSAEFERVHVEGEDKLKGLESGRVHLVLKCKGKRYQIRMAEICVKTDHGWVLFPEARWYGVLD